MARRRGVDKDAVVATALALADRDGLAAVTLARVAEELGIQAPSLYSHVEGLPGLRRDLAHAATVEMGEALRDAAIGRSGRDALVAVSAAYRGWALAHPGRYDATLWPVDPADDERVAGARRAQDAFAAVIRSYALDRETGRRAGRAWRAALHGLVTLERERQLGTQGEAGAFDYLVAVFAEGLARDAQSAAAARSDAATVG